jgi:hypothetical protein
MLLKKLKSLLSSTKGSWTKGKVECSEEDHLIDNALREPRNRESLLVSGRDAPASRETALAALPDARRF